MHALHLVWKCLHACWIHFAFPASLGKFVVSSLYATCILCISGCKIAFFLHPFCIHSVATPCILHLWWHPHFIHCASHACPLHLQYMLNASNLGMHLWLGNCKQVFDNFDFNTNSYSVSHIRLSMDGGWVMYHTLRHSSAVGFDMALEKCYNKPAKVTC